METFYITCIDKIGLTFDDNFHQIKIEIPYIYSNDKIKILCVNKYNELYNPKYPYFFVNINDIICCIDANITIVKNNIIVELVNKNPIYKIKFINLCNLPVYCFTSGERTFRQIAKDIYHKYFLSHNTMFTYNNLELKFDTYIKDCNFNLNTINEIYHLKGNLSDFHFYV